MNDFLDVGETKFNLCSAFLALLHKIITLSPFFSVSFAIIKLQYRWITTGCYIEVYVQSVFQRQQNCKQTVNH